MGNDCKNKMTLVQSLRYCRNDTCGIKMARNGSVCFGVLGCRPLPSLYLCALFPRLRVSVSPFPLATACGFCPQNSPSRTAQSQYPPCKWHVDFFLRSQILLLWLLQQNIHFYCYCKHFRRASKVSIRCTMLNQEVTCAVLGGAVSGNETLWSWSPALTRSVHNTVGKTWTWKDKLWGFNQFLFLRCLNVCWSGA